MWPFTRKKKPEPPKVAMQAKAVSVNPTPSERDARNEGRMARLEAALQRAEPGSPRAVSLQSELDRRRRFGK